MDNKVWIYGGVFLIAVILLGGVFVYFGNPGAPTGKFLEGIYEYPDAVTEPNGDGGAIRTELLDTANWNSNWVVCSANYLGDTPMSVEFHNINFNANGVYEFTTRRSGSGAKMDVSCLDQNQQPVAMKTNWLPINGVHRLNIPGECLVNNGFTVKWSRVGGNCLKFQYMRLYESQQLQPPQDGNIYPSSITEPNGNNNILHELWDTANWNSNWVVCSANYLGSTPMEVVFNNVNLNNGVYEFTTRRSGSGAKMDVSCLNQNNQQVAMKTNWLPANGEHTLNIPGECIVNNVFTVKWTRVGGNCLKFQYMRLSEQQQPGQPLCTETDNGRDVTKQGNCLDPGNGTNDSLLDSCSNNNVKEYFCAEHRNYNHPTCVYDYIGCAGGKICQNGACVEPPSLCSETDNGRDVTKQGNCLDPGNGTNDSLLDSCGAWGGRSYIVEYFCDDNINYNHETCIINHIYCEGGKTCQNGVCQ